MKPNAEGRRQRRIVSEKPCLICGRTPCDPHHYIRQSHGGTDDPKNLVPLCREHHRAYHDGDHQIAELLEAVAPHYFARQ